MRIDADCLMSFALILDGVEYSLLDGDSDSSAAAGNGGNELSGTD